MTSTQLSLVQDIKIKQIKEQVSLNATSSKCLPLPI